MNILVVTPVFSLAGVPLAQLRFARALVSRGHKVTLIIGRIDPQYTFPDTTGIEVINLDKANVRSMFGSVCTYLTTLSPDVVFSAEDHLNCLILLAAIVTRSKTKISCSSRVTPYDTYSNVPLNKRWVLKQLMRLVMPRADVLTCVSNDMVDQYRAVFRSPKHVCVYNIVDDANSRQRMLEPVDDEWFHDTDRPLLVAAGRLAPWKGFSNLIQSMSLGPAEQGARLVILGDGPLRSSLQSQIEDLQLQQSVRLLGYVDNPLKYFRRAKIFVLSSLVEGMPNVLVEAMMCGCTPVSTDCPTGPRELLDNGRIGYLVRTNDHQALASGILQAIEKPTPPEQLLSAIRPFAEDAVLDRHFELLGLSELDQMARAPQ